MNTQRNVSIDFLKCFAIFAVVLGHVLERIDGPENMLRVFIYSFHMPLFFMASGFLGGGKCDSRSVLKKKAIKKLRLLIPFFVVGAIYTYYSGTDLITNFLFATGKNGYWFLLALFLIFVIYYLVYAISFKLKSWLFVCVIYLVPYAVTVLLKQYSETDYGKLLGVDMLSNYLYFIVGVLLRRYEKLMALIDKDFIQFVLFIVYVIIFVSDIHLLSPIMKVSFILFAFGIVRKFDSNLRHWQKQLAYIGTRTLDIYVFHYFFIYGLYNSVLGSKLEFLSVSPSLYIPVYFVISVFVCLMVMFVSLVIRANKHFKTFVLGLN